MPLWAAVHLEQMASPFTEMEFYTILFSLVVFSLFTLHGLIQERCVHTTGSEDIKERLEEPLIYAAFFIALETSSPGRDPAPNSGWKCVCMCVCVLWIFYFQGLSWSSSSLLLLSCAYLAWLQSTHIIQTIKMTTLRQNRG
ncbi:hypothetical protein F2P79_008268 [Pimephales promelas]|nr:hypothetical protein F2P79_008268 [Pimephales promelas]